MDTACEAVTVVRVDWELLDNCVDDVCMDDGKDCEAEAEVETDAERDGAAAIDAKRPVAVEAEMLSSEASEEDASSDAAAMPCQRCKHTSACEALTWCCRVGSRAGSIDGRWRWDRRWGDGTWRTCRQA